MAELVVSLIPLMMAIYAAVLGWQFWLGRHEEVDLDDYLLPDWLKVSADEPVKAKEPRQSRARAHKPVGQASWSSPAPFA